MIIEELIKNGIDYFCISPGSRSTPLTYAVATNRKARSIIYSDERAAAYHAIGYAHATGVPAVLICTSGTAPGNYYPAIIEAAQSNIPLVVLSADRPPELRETGANQTIDQIKLYQSYVRWFYDMPCPTEKIAPETVSAHIGYAIDKTRMPLHGGPVHLNCMFREPLAPGTPYASISYQKKCDCLINAAKPAAASTTSVATVADDGIKKLIDILNRTDRGIIVLGELPLALNKAVIKELIDKLKWPVFPDILSGYRHTSSAPYSIHYYDQLLLSSKLQSELKDCTIVHIGGRIISKRFFSTVDLYKPQHYISISEYAARYDPLLCVTKRYYSDIKSTVEKLALHVSAKPKSSLVEKFINYQQKVSDILKNRLRMKEDINEISAAQIISRLMPSSHGLFLGNSMPIRDMDMYAEPGSDFFIAANRGASGIDGTVSSATGFAMGLGKPVSVVLGDLALLHDLNALSVIKELELPMQVVVINNGGGAIFSFLPIAKEQEMFERFFAAEHAITFEHAAHLFDISYMQPSTNRALQDYYLKAIKSNRPVLIEIKTDRKENYRCHQDIQQQIIATFE